MNQLSVFLLFITLQPAFCSGQYRFDKAELAKRVEIMSSDEFEGRLFGTPGAAKTRDLLVPLFQNAGLTPFHKYLTDTFKSCVNIVGMIEGTAQADKYIVITAHYDHLGIHHDQIYNGADDNASGVSALIALAEWFADHPPQHSLVFAAVDGEEHGFLGSRHMVKNLPVAPEQIVLNINMDMISRSDNHEIYICGTRFNKWLRDPLREVAAKYKPAVLFGHDGLFLNTKNNWVKASDHFPFHKAGIPFIYLGVEDHEDYHKPTDVYDSIDIDFYADVVDLILSTTIHLDNLLTGD